LWHVYSHGGGLHRLITHGDQIVSKLVTDAEVEPEVLIPDGWVFPERTDANFAWALHLAGRSIKWAPWDDEIYAQYADADWAAPHPDQLEW